VILVDTSAWIAFFRDKRPAAGVVDRVLESDEAALCGPVVTELMRGFKSPSERTRCRPLLEACHQLPEPPDLWNEAGDLGFLLARKGITVKSFDLLIATFALAHAVPVLTLDRDFDLMAKAGIGLHLAFPVNELTLPSSRQG
jgi:predicted nucleic acid-binding protein